MDPFQTWSSLTSGAVSGTMILIPLNVLSIFCRSSPSWVFLLPLATASQLPSQPCSLSPLDYGILQGILFCFSSICCMSSCPPVASTTKCILWLPDTHLQLRTLNQVACYSSPLKCPTGTTVYIIDLIIFLPSPASSGCLNRWCHLSPQKLRSYLDLCPFLGPRAVSQPKSPISSAFFPFPTSTTYLHY